MRANIDLRTARIKYSNRVASGENFIQINNTEESILIAFESVLEFDRWATGFQYQQKMLSNNSIFGENQAVNQSMMMMNNENSILGGETNQSSNMIMGGGMMRQNTTPNNVGPMINGGMNMMEQGAKIMRKG